MSKPRLYAPGPVAVPPAVLEALARPVVHHRTSSFRATFVRVREGLAQVAMVPGEDVMVLGGSGTTAFEATLLATVPEGGRVTALLGGKFGERWAELAKRFGLEVHTVDLPWGRAFDPVQVAEAVALGPQPDVVTMVHSETSTGVLHDVAGVASALRAQLPDALLLVDAVTSLAVTELRPLDWGLDAVVSGSQKGVMLPPGLGFTWLSERAWARVPQARRLRAYSLDLHAERSRQQQGDSGTTPATSMIHAAEVALQLLSQEPAEERWARKRQLNDALLVAGTALGATPFAQRPSPAVAALRTPDDLDAEQVVKTLATWGLRIAGGQDQLRGKLLRPSLLGDVDRYDAVIIAAALEDAWRRLGRSVAPGAAVGALLAALPA